MLFTFLRTWTQEIVILIILALVIDSALPDSTLRKYVDYGVSLVLLAILLSPIITLLHSTQDVSSMLRVAEGSYSLEYQMHEQRFEAASWVAYELILKDQVEEMIRRLPGIKLTHIKVSLDQNPSSQSFGQPTNMELWIDKDKNKTEEEIEKSLSELIYNLEHNYGINMAFVRIIIDR